MKVNIFLDKREREMLVWLIKEKLKYMPETNVYVGKRKCLKQILEKLEKEVS